MNRPNSEARDFLKNRSSIIQVTSQLNRKSCKITNHRLNHWWKWPSLLFRVEEWKLSLWFLRISNYSMEIFHFSTLKRAIGFLPTWCASIQRETSHIVPKLSDSEDLARGVLWNNFMRNELVLVGQKLRNWKWQDKALKMSYKNTREGVLVFLDHKKSWRLIIIPEELET